MSTAKGYSNRSTHKYLESVLYPALHTTIKVIIYIVQSTEKIILLSITCITITGWWRGKLKNNNISPIFLQAEPSVINIPVL